MSEMVITQALFVYLFYGLPLRQIFCVLFSVKHSNFHFCTMFSLHSFTFFHSNEVVKRLFNFVVFEVCKSYIALGITWQSSG